MELSTVELSTVELSTVEFSTVHFVNKGKTAKNVNQLSFCGTFDSENAFLKIKSYMKINDLNVTN